VRNRSGMRARFIGVDWWVKVKGWLMRGQTEVCFASGLRMASVWLCT
jgi:hypothetical protein